MDLNICKKCTNFCLMYDLNRKEDEVIMIVKSNGIFENIHFEEKLNKKMNSILDKYCFYGDNYARNYIIRNFTMKKNDFCPYFVEHLMSDLKHKSRVKSWKKKQKKIISLKKQLEKERKGVILCQEDQQQKIITM